VFSELAPDVVATDDALPEQLALAEARLASPLSSEAAAARRQRLARRFAKKYDKQPFSWNDGGGGCTFFEDTLLVVTAEQRPAALARHVLEEEAALSALAQQGAKDTVFFAVSRLSRQVLASLQPTADQVLVDPCC